KNEVRIPMKKAKGKRSWNLVKIGSRSES
ncbi:hypothetical protein A2U01_0043080, partial [Trifolium medium]|nr:hypothetical protein [Trifolium medium]